MKLNTYTSLLIFAGIFVGCFLNVICLYYFLSRFRPSVHQLQPLPQKPTAEDPKKVLRTIPVVSYTENEEFRECSVCLSSIVDGEKVRFLPGCGHGFHARCIDEWLGLRLSCPFCRSPVTSLAVSSVADPEAVKSLAGLESV